MLFGWWACACLRFGLVWFGGMGTENGERRKPKRHGSACVQVQPPHTPLSISLTHIRPTSPPSPGPSIIFLTVNRESS